MVITLNPKQILFSRVFPERLLYNRIRKKSFQLRSTFYDKDNKGKKQTPEYFAHLISSLFENKIKSRHLSYHNAKEKYLECRKEINPEHIKFHSNYQYSLIIHKDELTLNEIEFDKLHHLLEWMEKWVVHYSHEFAKVNIKIIKKNKDIMEDLLMLIYKTAFEIRHIKHILRRDISKVLRKDKNFSDKSKKEIEKKFEEFHTKLTDELKKNWKGYQTQIDNQGWKFVLTKARKEILNTRTQEAKLFYSKVNTKKSIKLRYEIKELRNELSKAEKPEEIVNILKKLLHELEEKVSFLCKASESNRAYLHFLEYTIHKTKHYSSKIGLNQKRKEEVEENFKEIGKEWKKTFYSLEDLSRRIYYLYGKNITKFHL